MMSLSPKTLRSCVQRLASAIENAGLTTGLSGLVQARAHYVDMEDKAERRGRRIDQKKHRRRVGRIDDLIDAQLNIIHDREEDDR